MREVYWIKTFIFNNNNYYILEFDLSWILENSRNVNSAIQIDVLGIFSIENIDLSRLDLEIEKKKSNNQSRDVIVEI